jgi:hypothetical protein
MLQRPSKPVASAARDRPRAAGPQVPAKSPVDVRSRAPRSRVAPLAQPGPAEASAGGQSAAAPQSYLQWAEFMAGSPNGDFGSGAYFVDQETGGTIRYTWTPKTWTPKAWTPKAWTPKPNLP